MFSKIKLQIKVSIITLTLFLFNCSYEDVYYNEEMKCNQLPPSARETCLQQLEYNKKLYEDYLKQQ